MIRTWSKFQEKRPFCEFNHWNSTKITLNLIKIKKFARGRLFRNPENALILIQEHRQHTCALNVVSGGAAKRLSGCFYWLKCQRGSFKSGMLCWTGSIVELLANWLHFCVNICIPQGGQMTMKRERSSSIPAITYYARWHGRFRPRHNGARGKAISI